MQTHKRLMVVGVTALMLFGVAKVNAELVGYWPMDEGYGTTLTDLSGLGHDATIDPYNEDVIRWSSAGYNGSALYYTNIQSAPYTYVDAPIAAGLLNTSAASYGFWIKVPQSYKTYGVMFDLVSENRDHSMEMGPGGGLWSYVGAATQIENGIGSGLNDDTWHHVAVTFGSSGMIFYVDGQQLETNDYTDAVDIVTVRMGGPRAHALVWATYKGLLDEVVVFNETLSADQVRDLYENGVQVVAKGASNPVPNDEAVDVSHDIILSWQPDETAIKRNVYLGTDANAVAEATLDAPGDVEVTENLDVNSLNPGRLVFGQEYFWRVDEVNESEVISGAVWGFQVEPYSIPIAGSHITANASSQVDTAIRTIDGSGLVDGEHGTDATTMWLSNGEANAWLEYTFDKVYRLDQMLVWNHNMQLEAAFGLGAKDVVVSYSEDGTTWTPLTSVSVFEQASGDSNYAANTAVTFGGVKATAVRIEMQSTWGGSMGPGLSEVQFMAVPEAARQPVPAAGEIDVDVPVVLSWRSGRSTDMHRVYFSTDVQAVLDRSVTPVEVAANTLRVNDVTLDTQYFWCVDEVNGADVWAGDVWDFNATAAQVIDDFESYTDMEPNRIFDVWADRYFEDDNGDPDNGAQVGHWDPPFAEMGIKLSGSQSMPLYYANDDTATITEATYTIPAADKDWTLYGVDTLVVNYQGVGPAGSVVEDNGVYTIEAAGGDIWGTADYCQFAYATISGDCTIIARVDSVEGDDGWVKAGVMIRDSLDADSTHAMVCLTTEHGITFGRRLATGGNSTSDGASEPVGPYWVKLTRSGSSFSAAISADGSTWEDLGETQTISMMDDDYVGLVLSSHRGRTEPVATAVYSNVSTTPAVSLDDVAEINPDVVFNEPELLYVVLQDSSNKSVKVDLDVAGTTAVNWTEGLIDLASMSGQLNVASMKTLTIGIGDGNAGSSGIVYIDDIQLVTGQ